jgi:hypothetical protein
LQRAIAQQDAPTDYGAFEPFLQENSAQCVPVAAIEKAADRTETLNEGAFRFVQALYLAVPPVSRDMPPGDHAAMATDKQGHVIVYLIDGIQTCARLALPPFLAPIVEQVERREYAHVGKGA